MYTAPMTQALAAEPNRATTSVVISWGLLNIPVSLYLGTEETRVARKEYTADGLPVGRATIVKETGETIDRSEIVKMAESTDGKLVPLSDDELAAITTDRGLASVVTFVPNAKVDQYVTEGLIQVRAKRDKGKPLPGSEKALGLLFVGMERTKTTALLNVATRGPARYALLDSAGNLRYVVTADCIRQPRPMPEVAITMDEATMAAKLIGTIGKSAPVLTDETQAAIQRYVDAKASGVYPVPDVTPDPTGPDLIDTLMASIAASKTAKVSA